MATPDTLDSLIADSFIDLRPAGYELTSIGNLLQSKPFQLLTSPLYEEPTMVATDSVGGITLQRKQKGTNGILTLRVDPALGNSIIRLEYFGNDKNNTKASSKCRYDAAINSIFFPTIVETERTSTDRDLKEVIRFTSRHLNEPADPTAFDPKYLELRYNSMVQVVDKKKGGVNFFDGKKLVKSPPDPSEYLKGDATGPTSANQPRYLRYLYWAVGALLLTAAAFLLYRGVRRKGQP